VRKELEERLFAIEPAFFRERDDLCDRCLSRAPVFQCGDGWFPLVEELLLAAKRRLDNPSWVPNEAYDPEKPSGNGNNPQMREPRPCGEETRAAWEAQFDEDASVEYAWVDRIVCDGSDFEHPALDWPEPSKWYTQEQREADIEREGPYYTYYQHTCERPWTHFRVVQVKEKFGGLHFYYMGGDAQFAGLVSMTELLSYRICEACGAWATATRTPRDPETGKPRGLWAATLCAEHHAMRDAGKTTGDVIASAAPVFEREKDTAL
jgi:hypothetical protein